MSATVISPIASREGRIMRRLAVDEWPPTFFTATRPPFELWISRSFLGAALPRRRPGAAHHQPDQVMSPTQRPPLVLEIYPPDDQVIDVANMRHLWLLDEAPAYAWRKGR